MVFNFCTHCDYLHSLKSYVLSHTFLTAYGWGQDGSANVLVDKQTKDLGVLMVVEKVVHDRLFCGPSGNWSTNNSYGSLEGAKYQLTLCPPDEDIFLNEFDIAFKTLGKVQSSIAATHERHNLLIGEDEKVNNIKFSKLVFEERDEVRTRFF